MFNGDIGMYLAMHQPLEEAVMICYVVHLWGFDQYRRGTIQHFDIHTSKLN